MGKSKLYDLLTFRNVTILGLVLCLALTTFILVGGRYANFMIFQQATLDFWNGISPYTDEWFRHGYDYYLYSPIFNVLFAPFAYLPHPVGLFAWNLLNYLLVVYAIHTFQGVTNGQKSRTLLFLLPILAPALMSCQYNMVVASVFVLGFSLMERGRPIAAITLILISGMTKIYGLAELSILIFYPKVWRNVGYAVLFAVIIAALPAIRWGMQYGELLGQWFDALTSHAVERTWETFYDISLIPWGGARHVLTPYIQVGTFALLAIVVLIKSKLWVHLNFRFGVVALMMGWCILFGNSSETHTYLISVLGFVLWYYMSASRTLMKSLLYWAVFVVVVVVPLDVIFPLPVFNFIYHTVDLNKWLMLWLWIYMSVRVLGNGCYIKRGKDD